jgi:hypothetical protein
VENRRQRRRSQERWPFARRRRKAATRRKNGRLDGKRTAILPPKEDATLQINEDRVKIVLTVAITTPSLATVHLPVFDVTLYDKRVTTTPGRTRTCNLRIRNL